MIELLTLAVLISLVFLVVVIFGFIIRLWKGNLNFKEISSDSWFDFSGSILKWLLILSVLGVFVYLILFPVPTSWNVLCTRILDKAKGFAYLIGLLLVAALFTMFEFAICLGIVEGIVGTPNKDASPKRRNMKEGVASQKSTDTTLTNDPVIQTSATPKIVIDPVTIQERKRYEDITRVDCMNPLRFEKFCAELLEYNGFYNIKMTPESGDQGVDIIAKKNNIRYAIQCKHYQGNVGNSAVQEVHTGKTYYNCSVGIVMTNSYFTSKAKDLAEASQTILWDRIKIQKLMKSAAKRKYP